LAFGSEPNGIGFCYRAHNNNSDCFVSFRQQIKSRNCCLETEIGFFHDFEDSCRFDLSSWRGFETVLPNCKPFAQPPEESRGSGCAPRFRPGIFDRHLSIHEEDSRKG
jgi:hypothetical protein